MHLDYVGVTALTISAALLVTRFAGSTGASSDVAAEGEP
jgi:hypothetical protein